MSMFETIFNWVTPALATIYIWALFLLGCDNANKPTKQLNIMGALVFTAVFWIVWFFVIL